MGSATSAGGGDEHPLVHRLNRRNSLEMVVKNYPAACLVRYGHLLALNVLLGVGGAVAFRRPGAHLGALAEFPRRLPGTLRKRRAIQRARRIGRRELEAVVRRRP